MIAFVIGFLGVLVAQIVKGTVGFGGALVAMPVLTLVYEPTEAIFLSACCDVVSGAVLLPGVWRLLRWVLVIVLLTPMIAGQWVAAGIVPYIPVAVFTVGLGCIVLLLGISFAIRPVRPGAGELTDLPDDDSRPLRWASLGGLGAGLMSGMFGTPGPPVVVYFKRFFSDRFSRAHLIALFMPGAMALVVIMTIKGTVGDPSATMIRGMGFAPAVILGGLLGAKLAPRLSRETFGRVVGIVLAAAGLTLMLTSL